MAFRDSRASSSIATKNIAASSHLRVAVCCSLLLGSLGAANAEVVYHLPNLISSSDVVAVVRVTATSQTGSGSVEVPGGRSVSAYFRVAGLHLQQILKGETASTDITVPYTILYSPGGWGGGVAQWYAIHDTLLPNSTRLVFLKSIGDHYEFTNGSYLSMVCAPEAAGEQSGDGLSRVLSRVTGAMFSAQVSEQDKSEAIDQLGAVDTVSVIPALQNFLAAHPGRQNEFLRTEALLALLNHKVQSAVGLAQSELMSGNFPYWQSNLLVGITRAAPPSRSIPILAEALASPSAQMRTSAAVAVYQTDSLQGVPVLLQALEDPDPEVAFAVMQGLGGLTMQYNWRPKSTEPDADWFRCLNHWRDFRQEWNSVH